eukprot:scaffold14576_cov132-Isochrysis_galbana.AAC.4
MRRPPVPPIVVYTDAAFEPDDPRPAGLGACVYDPLAPEGHQWVVVSGETSPEVIGRWRARRQYIGQLEALAAVATYYTLADGGRTARLRLRWARLLCSCRGAPTAGRRLEQPAPKFHENGRWSVRAEVYKRGTGRNAAAAAEIREFSACMWANSCEAVLQRQRAYIEDYPSCCSACCQVGCHSEFHNASACPAPHIPWSRMWPSARLLSVTINALVSIADGPLLSHIELSKVLHCLLLLRTSRIISSALRPSVQRCLEPSRGASRQSGIGEQSLAKPCCDVNPPDVYISKDLRFVNSSAKQDDAAKIREALQVLEEVLHPTSAAAKAAALKRLGASLSDGPTRMNGMIDILTDAFSKYTRVSDGDFQGVTPQYDSDVYRLEYRTKDTLRIVGFKPKVEVQSATRSVPVMEKVDPVVYAKAPASQWDGDKYWEAECARQKWDCKTRFQRRRLTQTRLFITWALHRPVTNEGEARAVLEKMRGAVEELFTDRHLSEMLRFGEKLVGTKPGERVVADSISRAQWATISAPRKADAQVYFYGGKGKEESSYLSDTYETHVEEVSVDAGCEIGPKRKHPHMHILLTVKHWSYMQLDTWHMSALFEAMFRGVGEWSDGRFKLWDASGLPFYTDQENPYINIKLYPQDNWQDIIANYVRKSSDLMSIVARTGGS